MSGSLSLGVSGGGVHCVGDSLLVVQSSSEPEDQGGLEADQLGRAPPLRLDQSETGVRGLDQSEGGVRGQSVGWAPGGDQDRSRDLDTWRGGKSGTLRTRETRDTVTVAPPSIREGA